MNRFYSAAGVLLVLCVSGTARAQTPVTVVNVWAAETGQFSRFGSDLHFLGDLMVIGAEGQPSPGAPGLSTGAVYAFRQTEQGPYGGYAEEAQLRPPTGSLGPFTRFGGAHGFSVGACVVPGGDTFVVGGAPGESIPNPQRPDVPFYAAGAAYVHRRDAATGAWSLDGRLAVLDPRENAYGGTATAITCEPPTVPGAAPTVEAVVWVDTRFVVWHRDAAGAWSMRQTIPFGVNPIPTYGVTDALVMSAPGPAASRSALVKVATSRRIEVWRRSGPETEPWTVEANLSSPLTGQSELYGRGLDIDRDLLVVGTENDPPSGPSVGGRAHVYRYTGAGPFGGWEEEAVLTPSVVRESFGAEVAVWSGPAGDGVGARVAVRWARGVTTFRRDASGQWREEVVLEQGPGPAYPWEGVMGAVNERYIAYGWYNNTSTRGAEAGVVQLLDLRSVVAGEDADAPGGASLAVAGPNPARGRTALALTLPEAGVVAVGLFDALGRQVAVLHEGALAAGTSQIAVDVSALPPGVYVVRAVGTGVAASVRLVVAR